MPLMRRSQTAFTLQVVEPHLNGPGGDVPIPHFTTPGRRSDRGRSAARGRRPQLQPSRLYRRLGLEHGARNGPARGLCAGRI